MAGQESIDELTGQLQSFSFGDKPADNPNPKTEPTRPVQPRISVPTALWGSVAWELLFLMAFSSYAQNCHAAWIRLLHMLRIFLPCMDCGEHFAQELQENSIPLTADDFSIARWLVARLASINLRLGKPAPDFESLKLKYTRIITEMKACYVSYAGESNTWYLHAQTNNSAMRINPRRQSKPSSNSASEASSAESPRFDCLFWYFFYCVFASFGTTVPIETAAFINTLIEVLPDRPLARTVADAITHHPFFPPHVIPQVNGHTALMWFLHLAADIGKRYPEHFEYPILLLETATKEFGYTRVKPVYVDPHSSLVTIDPPRTDLTALQRWLDPSNFERVSDSDALRLLLQLIVTLLLTACIIGTGPIDIDSPLRRLRRRRLGAPPRR